MDKAEGGRVCKGGGEGNFKKRREKGALIGECNCMEIWIIYTKPGPLLGGED